MKRRPSQTMKPASVHYGVGPIWYGMVLLALVLVGGLVWYFIHATSGGGPDESGTAVTLLIWLGVAGYALLRTFEGWVVFEVHDEGLRQRKFGRSRFAAWKDLVRVGSREIGIGDLGEGPRRAGDRGRLQEGSTDRDAFTFVVLDREGRPVFKIPPWVRHRKHLVREIQWRIRR